MFILAPVVYIVGSYIPDKIIKLSGIVYRGPNSIFFRSATDFIKICHNIKDFKKMLPKT